MSIFNRIKSSLSPKSESETPEVYTNKSHYTNFLWHNPNTNIGKETYHVDANLRKSQPLSSLSNDERMALVNYSAGSTGMNHHLETSAKEGKEPDPIHGRISLSHLDKAVSKFKLPKMTIFSGVAGNPNSKAKEGILKKHSLISTSIDPKVAHDFSAPSGDKHILRIHVPEGHPGFYFGNDINRSSKPEEHELLLPRNTTLKIHPKPTLFTHGSPDSTKHVWDAHIVPHGENPDTWQPPKIETPKFYRG